MKSQKDRLLINEELDLNIDLGKAAEVVAISTLIPQWEHKILNIILSEKSCENNDNKKIYLNLNDIEIESKS